MPGLRRCDAGGYFRPKAGRYPVPRRRVVNGPSGEDGDQAWSNTLTSYYNIVRKEIARYRGEEFTVAGDGFLVLFDGPARAVRCALTIAAAVKQLEIDV